MDLEGILAQVRAGDPVGAAYRLSQLLVGEGSAKELYRAGTQALDRRAELGEGALRFARLVFAEAVERDPNLGEAHHDLATAMRELGMAEDALRHYRRALELMPDDQDALIGLGVAHADLGQLDEAVETLRRATEAHPDSGRAQANLAIALEAAGHEEEAIGAYGRAVARFDAVVIEAADEETAGQAAAQRRWARIQQAELLERLERWPQAVVVYRRLYEEEQAIAQADEDEDEDEGEDEGERDLGSQQAPAGDSDDVGAGLLLRNIEAASASQEGATAAVESEGEAADGTEEEDANLLEEAEAGRLGLERVFSRLVQLGRLDLAYLVLDELGGELADERTRATYTVYDSGDGVPTIMVESWEDGQRSRLDPHATRGEE